MGGLGHDRSECVADAAARDLLAGTTAGPWLADHLSADKMEEIGCAPWLGKQPIEDFVRYRKGKPWVPLDAAIAQLQFWQRRDYEHSLSAIAAAPDLAAENATLRKALTLVEAAMLRGGDGQIGEFGWNITKLNRARALIRAALAPAKVSS